MQVLSLISFPKWLNPEIIPGLPLRWYGMMYLVAFFVAYQMVRIQVKEKALDVQKDDVLNMFFWGIVGLLVGARLFAVTIYAPVEEFLRQPWKIIVPVSIQGGKLRFTGLAGMSVPIKGGIVLDLNVEDTSTPKLVILLGVLSNLSLNLRWRSQRHKTLPIWMDIDGYLVFLADAWECLLIVKRNLWPESIDAQIQEFVEERSEPATGMEEDLPSRLFDRVHKRFVAGLEHLAE